MRQVKKLEIVLNRGSSEERKIAIPHHTANVVWEAFEIGNRAISGFKDKTDLEEVLATVCGWYDDLTLDDVLTGLDSQELMPFILDSCDYLTQGTIGRFDDLKNVATRATKTNG